MSMTATLTITINQPVQRASAARGLDAVARRLRDLESDHAEIGLSAEDALALGAALEAITAILAAVDPNASHHRPGHHLTNAVKHAEEVTY
jgi:hypothetical protein